MGARKARLPPLFESSSPPASTDAGILSNVPHRERVAYLITAGRRRRMNQPACVGTAATLIIALVIVSIIVTSFDFTFFVNTSQHAGSDHATRTHSSLHEGKIRRLLRWSQLRQRALHGGPWYTQFSDYVDYISAELPENDTLPALSYVDVALDSGDLYRDDTQHTCACLFPGVCPAHDEEKGEPLTPEELALFSQHNKEVIALTDHNMVAKLKEHTVLLLHVYSPACKVSRALTAVWSRIGRELKQHEVSVGQADGTKNPLVRREFGIAEYPTVLLVITRGDPSSGRLVAVLDHAAVYTGSGTAMSILSPERMVGLVTAVLEHITPPEDRSRKLLEQTANEEYQRILEVAKLTGHNCPLDSVWVFDRTSDSWKAASDMFEPDLTCQSPDVISRLAPKLHTTPESLLRATTSFLFDKLPRLSNGEIPKTISHHESDSEPAGGERYGISLTGEQERLRNMELAKLLSENGVEMDEVVGFVSFVVMGEKPSASGGGGSISGAAASAALELAQQSATVPTGTASQSFKRKPKSADGMQ